MYDETLAFLFNIIFQIFKPEFPMCSFIMILLCNGICKMPKTLFKYEILLQSGWNVIFFFFNNIFHIGQRLHIKQILILKAEQLLYEY